MVTTYYEDDDGDDEHASEAGIQIPICKCRHTRSEHLYNVHTGYRTTCKKCKCPSFRKGQ